MVWNVIHYYTWNIYRTTLHDVQNTIKGQEMMNEWSMSNMPSSYDARRHEYCSWSNYNSPFYTYWSTSTLNKSSVLKEVMSMAKSTHTTYLNNCSHSMCRNSILFTWYQLFAKSIIMCRKRSKFTNTNYKYKCWHENEYVVNDVCNVIDQFSAKYIDTV